MGFRVTFYKLCEELRPFIYRQVSNMRSPVEVEMQVALTLSYLANEGRLQKTANANAVMIMCFNCRKTSYPMQ